MNISVIRQAKENNFLSPQPKHLPLADAGILLHSVLFQDLFGLHGEAQGHIAEGFAFGDGVFLGFPVAVAQLGEIHHIAAVEDHLVGAFQQIVIAEFLELHAKFLSQLLRRFALFGIDEAHAVVLIDETFFSGHVDQLEGGAVGGRIGQFQKFVLGGNVGQLVVVGHQAEGDLVVFGQIIEFDAVDEQLGIFGIGGVACRFQAFPKS